MPSTGDTHFVDLVDLGNTRAVESCILGALCGCGTLGSRLKQKTQNVGLFVVRIVLRQTALSQRDTVSVCLSVTEASSSF